jgi:hypothetical protein
LARPSRPSPNLPKLRGSPFFTGTGGDMSPRKPTVDDLDDVDDEDGTLEEEVATNSDLDLTVTDESEAGLGGLPQNLPQEEE